MEVHPLPSGPASLCFNKEDFMRDDFNVDHFVVECRRRVPLETLRDDLHLYLRILQSAMIELINKDYADFVNLSTNLVGLDKAISNLTEPLNQLKEEVSNVRSSMDDAIVSVESHLDKQTQIRSKKRTLEQLVSIIESVSKIEKLLGIQSSDDTTQTYTSELNGQLIERVATEFNHLQFHVNKSRGLPLVELVRPRIAVITRTLQGSLERSFCEGLKTGQENILRQCLRTYAMIDKLRDAEALFRQHVVKPYMEEFISEEYIHGQPQGLKGMYAKILEFIPKHCRQLSDATAAKTKEGGEVVRGYDFMVNAVWPEIVMNIEARTPSIFAPGNPNYFHERYCVSMEFLDKFEHACGSQSSVKQLHAHPSYAAFFSKWSLPVYFQIRFQEIAGTFESSLTAPFSKSADGSVYRLHVTETLEQCIRRCWQNDIYLSALCHRVWKLTLQLFSRYASWIKDVQANQMKSSSSSADAQLASVAEGQEEDAVKPAAVTTEQLVQLIVDAETLAACTPDIFQQLILPCINQLGVKDTTQFQESVAEAASGITSTLHPFGDVIKNGIICDCAIHLKLVNDIPRLYRRTNREVPSKASSYVTSLLRPLQMFLKDQRDILPEEHQLSWAKHVINELTNQYLSITTDVLISVRKMEESLKRLKKSRRESVQAAGALSDDDKIRQQIYLDVHEFGNQIVQLKIDVSEVTSYSELVSVVEAAKAGQPIGALSSSQAGTDHNLEEESL